MLKMIQTRQKTIKDGGKFRIPCCLLDGKHYRAHQNSPRMSYTEKPCLWQKIMILPIHGMFKVGRNWFRLKQHHIKPD